MTSCIEIITIFSFFHGQCITCLFFIPLNHTCAFLSCNTDGSYLFVFVGDLCLTAAVRVPSRTVLLLFLDRVPPGHGAQTQLHHETAASRQAGSMESAQQRPSSHTLHRQVCGRSVVPNQTRTNTRKPGQKPTAVERLSIVLEALVEGII